MRPEVLLLLLMVALTWAQEAGDANAAVPGKSKDKDKLTGKQGEKERAGAIPATSNATDSNKTQAAAKNSTKPTSAPEASGSANPAVTTRGPPLIQVQPATTSIFNREGPPDCIGRLDFTLMWPLGSCRNCTSDSDCDKGFVCCKAREVGIRIVPVVLRDCCVLKRPPVVPPPGAPSAESTTVRHP